MGGQWCEFTFCKKYNPNDNESRCVQWACISNCVLHSALDSGVVVLMPETSQPTEPPQPLPRADSSIFETIAAEIGELVTEKNRCYGNSFAKCGDFLRLLYPSGIAPEAYDDALAMVRIFDKQMRIATQKEALSESPYRDIAGYGILGAAKDQGKG